MKHRVGGPHQAFVISLAKAKTRVSNVSQEDLDAGIEPMLEGREVQVKLHGLPQLQLSFTALFGTNQKVERLGVVLQQSSG